MLDHVFLTVNDIKRLVSFYEAELARLGVNERFDYGKNRPPRPSGSQGLRCKRTLILVAA